MARYPGASWLPLDAAYLPGKALIAHNRMNLHVAVSEAASLRGVFNRLGQPSSHFYVRKDGSVEQYVDTDQRAEADYEGNDATVSVETQGGVNNAQAEPWTDAQVEALARLFAWVVTTHGVPARLATDSRIGDTSKGLSWHRLGIDPWRVAGGMRYSTSRGKVCPGDAKIAQIPAVLARALALLGTPAEVSAPAAPAPAPVSSGPRVIAPGVPAPPFPLPAGSYFGPKSGPKASVSGYFSHRSDLARWQQRMKDRGWAIGVDGLYGPQTERIARAFQAEKGLVVDGAIGPITWAAAWTAPVTA